MRYAVFTTINGNSPLGKTLYSKISFRALKQCGHDQKGSLNSKKQFYSTCGFSKTFTRNLLDASNRLPLFYQIKRFSALPQERTHLMNLEIVKTPSIFQSLNRIVNYLIIKTIDKDFDMSEFVESSKTALVVVANLLSELKFSELDGLLTSECILEVEKNVRAMSPEKRRGLVVDIDDIYFSFPHYTKIIKGNISFSNDINFANLLKRN